MKRNKANSLAAINRTPLRRAPKSAKQLSGTLQIQQSGLTEVRNVPPPGEEIVDRLNALGREYPFCVINKPGNHLIL
ncbi:hypothetical protein [Pseudoflavitalea rhizosphaerae]|uniref:hypothetical protein n=1 Tax=Pseudoflavitalea rhizosphaerae TaxID=1884793 RepID=UPI000F8D565D|nr:hypothetical protein [Pseudoflavitalea rhizosphaerae]